MKKEKQKPEKKAKKDWVKIKSRYIKLAEINKDFNLTFNRNTSYFYNCNEGRIRFSQTQKDYLKSKFEAIKLELETIIKTIENNG
jgi:cell fate regulator YaaT (PSP1 superfamily)